MIEAENMRRKSKRRKENEVMMMEGKWQGRGLAYMVDKMKVSVHVRKQRDVYKPIQRKLGR